jgi:hypothetical protein
VPQSPLGEPHTPAAAARHHHFHTRRSPPFSATTVSSRPSPYCVSLSCWSTPYTY